MMKKLFLASLAIAALASCQKESLVDSTLTSGQQEMTFAPYAGASLTKGSAVGSNGEFATINKTFTIASYIGEDKYFHFTDVDYNTTSSAWENRYTVYWPTDDATIHYGAYSPASEIDDDYAVWNMAYVYDEEEGYRLSFNYTSPDLVGDQKDIMYAVGNYDYIAPTTLDGADKALSPHFKHALTQVAFTATKDAEISAAVKSIKLCNITKAGRFIATKATNVNASDDDINADQGADIVNKGNTGDWSEVTNYEGVTLHNYVAAMNSDDPVNDPIEVTNTNTKTILTSASDVLMLIPQSLTAWSPEDEVTTNSYLAIDCIITHANGDAPIVDGVIYVPFSTKGIEYNTAGVTNDVWNPGYKISYNLHFGGGYTIPGGGTDPEPGETPEDVIPTFREITYAVTVDEWITADGGNVTF